MQQQALISDQEKARLKRTFRKDLKAEVKLRLFTQRPSPIAVPGRDCRYCSQTEQLMQELTALSPKLHLETVDYYGQPEAAQQDGVSRVPAIVLGADKSSRVRFYGIPMGYEMATIFEDIMTLSKGTSPLSMDTRKRLRSLNQPVHVQVFVTPTCVYCPAMARLAHALAMENRHITSDVIEVQEFPALAQKYGVKSVPLTVINEYPQAVGVVSEAELLEKVLQAGVRAQDP